MGVSAMCSGNDIAKRLAGFATGSRNDARTAEDGTLGEGTIAQALRSCLSFLQLRPPLPLCARHPCSGSRGRLSSRSHDGSAAPVIQTEGGARRPPAYAHARVVQQHDAKSGGMRQGWRLPRHHLNGYNAQCYLSSRISDTLGEAAKLKSEMRATGGSHI